tara:strand:- start:675 stop:1301 length:627 start_codon:yes stop_codon:yes gene_type:complete
MLKNNFVSNLIISNDSNESKKTNDRKSMFVLALLCSIGLFILITVGVSISSVSTPSVSKTNNIVNTVITSSITTSLENFVPGDKRMPGDIGNNKVQSNTTLEPDVVIEIGVMTPAYLPNTVTVKQGQVVKLVLTGMDDGVLPGISGITEFTGHGFHIAGNYDIWITGLRKGVVKEVIFEATEKGEFQIQCVVFCSPQHYLMLGTFIVE